MAMRLHVLEPNLKRISDPEITEFEKALNCIFDKYIKLIIPILPIVGALQWWMQGEPGSFTTLVRLQTPLFISLNNALFGLTRALGLFTAINISVRNGHILNVLSATNIADMNPESTATAHLQISKGTSDRHCNQKDLSNTLLGCFFFAQDALPHHPPQLTASHRKNCQGKVDEDGTPAIFQALTRVEWFG
ncbi:hypothetical protein LguiA_026239 [Lonicera macranthoides]